ncbi:transposase [bacterium]|nr:transposase [bacterium]
MARALRINLVDGWYHVSARGNERRNIFRDNRDRDHLLELLAEAVDRFGWRLHAYVLMDNHWHLLVQTPRANLSAAMQWVNQSSGGWFNRRHQRSGHLFHGRFKAVVVEAELYATVLSRYLHLNPVCLRQLGMDKQAQQRQRAGGSGPPDPQQVRQRLERLRRYRWSSFRAYAGLVPRPGWLETRTVLRMLGRPTQGSVGRAYQAFVEREVREAQAASPWEQLAAGVILGSERFVTRMQGLLEGDEKEQPGLRRLRQATDIKQVMTAVEEVQGQRWAQFRDRYGDPGRDLVLYFGRKRCGLKLGELGELVGGIDDSSVGMAVRRLEERARRDRRLAGVLQRVAAQLEG